MREMDKRKADNKVKRTRAQNAEARAIADQGVEPGSRKRHEHRELLRTEDRVDQEIEEVIEPGALVDQGDGVRVSRRGWTLSELVDDESDLPDEPPPGWCDV